MTKIRTILVDDEESARDVLENLLLRFCPEIELIAKCKNVLEAVEQIKIHQPDLVFLDIEMPNYAGYEIVKFFEEVNFSMIFVTAYDNYAIRAFEVAAVDYLLKPIEIQRLKDAVSRFQKSFNYEKHQIQQQENLALLKSTLETNKVKKISVIDKGEQHILLVDDISAIEAQESYSIIYTDSKKYMVSKNLKHFETIFKDLPEFFRVHKSWIINLKELKSYSKSELSIQLNNGIVTKLSKYKKAEFEIAILS
jgi:two-component system LytT family response regulator